MKPLFINTLSLPYVLLLGALILKDGGTQAAFGSKRLFVLVLI